ncbi:MAG: hypothetical protein JRI69_13850 [Deltaproteobacteria bacterium]|nr:hypothetical protein [Deltaproteobacteria bacterium]MBW2014844.1 hypothetical protein [Deltaproteobacteria bacterium]MBW2090095.1 hypothetical protein [Deltaproteobacteria bacterium]
MKHKWIIISVFILIVVSIFIFYLKEDEVFPDPMIGRWTTSEPRYTDRFFELSQTTFTYGLGGDKKDLCVISSIEKSVQDNNTLYTINYHNIDGMKYTRSFYYYPANGGVIKFKKQEGIKWTKNKNAVSEENPESDKNTKK